jgi:hypothetical protein
MSYGQSTVERQFTVYGPILAFKHSVDSMRGFHLLSQQRNIRICSDSSIQGIFPLPWRECGMCPEQLRLDVLQTDDVDVTYEWPRYSTEILCKAIEPLRLAQCFGPGAG